MALPQRKTDVGPPHFEQFLPPVIKKNYGNWKYHEVITPGTMVHVAESGDKLWSVRVASPRLLSNFDLLWKHALSTFFVSRKFGLDARTRTQ